MTNNRIDQMWNQAMNEAIKNGENFTRYRFATLIAAAEREACAKRCDEARAARLAEQIKARGEKV